MSSLANEIADILGLPLRGVVAVLELTDEGATIPFIARYRKERTDVMDEEQIEQILSERGRLLELAKRKESILNSISEQGKLTDQLRESIEEANEISILEDLYLPYKQKRKTRASIARDAGLESLAKQIMSGNMSDVNQSAGKFVKGDVTSVALAIAGARDIIAEWVNENGTVRSIVRSSYYRYAHLSSKLVKAKEKEGDLYRIYFDWSCHIDRLVSHRVLAVMRGANEGILRISFTLDKDRILDRLEKLMIKQGSTTAYIVKEAIKDSLKRLITPSIEREVLSKIKEDSDSEAVSVFATNLKQLLLSAPLGQKRVLAIDPGQRTGCKVVCLNESGDIENNAVFFLFGSSAEYNQAERKLSHLIEAYRIEVIAVGNGTAGRHTEKFVRRIPIVHQRNIDIFSVNEDGASIYSASKLARKEFPLYDVTVRGAISIGRRLMDPLAELVKIDPKSLGVGQYQHDVDQKQLQSSLDRVVESCVNQVGVNVNTASEQILTYISGIGPSLAKGIVEYRTEHGEFKSRDELMLVPRLSKRVFQQCAGFLRVADSTLPLDNTTIHPESYSIVKRIADSLKISIESLMKNPDILVDLTLDEFVTESIGLPTIEDIVEAITVKKADPRERLEVFQFDDNINSISDLTTGSVITGIVMNVTKFGAFIDLGIKENGLLHISEMGEKFVSNPADIVTLQQSLKVKIKDVDLDKKRISLTLKGI